MKKVLFILAAIMTMAVGANADDLLAKGKDCIERKWRFSGVNVLPADFRLCPNLAITVDSAGEGEEEKCEGTESEMSCTIYMKCSTQDSLRYLVQSRVKFNGAIVGFFTSDCQLSGLTGNQTN